MARILTVVTALVLLSACEDETLRKRATVGSSGDSSLPTPERFAQQYPTFERYWYQGRAELTRYALRQARYGDVHDGEAVLIFVTEDFLSNLQVKQEHGDSPDAVSVLKLNAYRRFYTGIYPYTVMTSSFTPATGSPTLKLSNTVQEWCGQVYSQVNRRNDGLHARMHSYFQDDADQKVLLPNAPLEDGVWAQIRIDPSRIEEGGRELVPGLDFIRMRHKALRAYPAVVTRTPDARTELVDHPVTALQIEYPPLARTLVIYYEPEFPFVIQAWEEIEGPFRTTAVRTHAVVDDYWNHNRAGDASYREALGLRF